MRYKSSRRGRPYGRYRSQVDIRLLEYLAKVSVKYRINSDKLLNSFLEASQHQESRCGKLSIKCREKEQGYVTFLMTLDQSVVGQFRMSKYLINEKSNMLQEFASRLSTVRTTAQEPKPNGYKIRDLRTGMKRLEIKARVLEVSQPMQIATRSGFCTNLANALIADETGTIKLSLFGSQIKMVSVHDDIQIENARVAWFKGERQLRIGKGGKINVV